MSEIFVFNISYGDNWIFSGNEYLPWVDSRGFFCVVLDSSKEHISGEIALLTFFSNLGTFMVLIDWSISLSLSGEAMSAHYSVSAELKYIGTCVGDADIVIRSEPDLRS